MSRQDRVEMKSILVTGVTGYIGGRLVPRVLAAGYRVRVMAGGSAERLNGRSWRKQMEVAVGDVLNPKSLTDALTGIDAAYYLIHSMGGNDRFRSWDVQAAQNVARAAADAADRPVTLLMLDSRLRSHKLHQLSGAGSPFRQGLFHNVPSRRLSQSQVSDRQAHIAGVH